MASKRAKEYILRQRLKRRQKLSERQALMTTQLNKRLKQSLGSIDGIVRVFGLEKTAVFELMRQAAMDGDEVAIRFCNGVKGTPSEILENESVDSLCALWKIRPSDIIGLVVTQLRQFKHAVANLKAAMALDDVIDATIASAKNITSQIGLEDRKILLKQQKFIEPEAKGPLVTIDQRRVEVNTPAKDFEQLIKAAAERPALKAAEDIGVVDAEIS